MGQNDAIAALKEGAAAWHVWVAERRHRLGAAGRSSRVFERIDLSGLELPSGDLSHFDLRLVDLSGANLAHARLARTNLQAADLSSANLAGADLFATDLGRASLWRATLKGAALQRARFDQTDLRSADLAGARLDEAAFHQCAMTETNLRMAITRHTVWANVDLRGVKHLDLVRHRGPSTIGLDTIAASGGDLPEVFLRGCGVSDGLIAYARSLARSTHVIEMYSCFISYSTRDHDFCQRLHNDLQAAGVRCWFAPEDLKIGDKIRDEIDSAIRVHDKLLLVLSEHSVRSEWVASEVEGAFERERLDRDRLVLFPVRLDDAVMDTSQAWAAEIRRRRHIGDFSGWKDHDAYTRAFDRLLRDLRATTSA